MSRFEAEMVKVKCLLVERRELSINIRQIQAIRRGSTRTIGMEVWIPRSQVDHIIVYGTNKDDPSVKDATITIPEWLAEEKRLDYDPA